MINQKNECFVVVVVVFEFVFAVVLVDKTDDVQLQHDFFSHLDTTGGGNDYGCCCCCCCLD